jgi:hypothetical protein
MCWHVDLTAVTTRPGERCAAQASRAPCGAAHAYLEFVTSAGLLLRRRFPSGGGRSWTWPDVAVTWDHSRSRTLGGVRRLSASALPVWLLRIQFFGVLASLTPTESAEHRQGKLNRELPPPTSGAVGDRRHARPPRPICATPGDRRNVQAKLRLSGAEELSARARRRLSTCLNRAACSHPSHQKNPF